MERAKGDVGTIRRKETWGLSAGKLQVGGSKAQLGIHPQMVEGARKAATLDRDTPRKFPTVLAFSSSL